MRGERGLAREAKVERRSQTKNVGANVHVRGIHRLLGRHVTQRAQQGSRICQTSAKMQGQAKVQQLRRVLRGHQDVRGLDVAMNHVAAMRCLQGAGNLINEFAGARHAQRPVGHQLLQVRADHIFHDQVVEVMGLMFGRLAVARVQRSHNVRMTHAGQHAHLDEKALEQGFIGVRGRLQHFDGDRTAHEHVLASIDDAHAANADTVQNPIIAEDQLLHAPGANARCLVVGDQPVFHEQRQQLVARGRIEQTMTNSFVNGLPLLQKDYAAFNQSLQKKAAGGQTLGRGRFGIGKRGRRRDGFAAIHGFAPPRPRRVFVPAAHRRENRGGTLSPGRPCWKR